MKLSSSSIRPIAPEEYSLVRERINANDFLPRHSWDGEALGDMAYRGLISGKWIAFGYFSDLGELTAYADIKERGEINQVELGIGFVEEAYRNQGLAKEMLLFLIDRYGANEIITKTAASNKAMIACFEKMGFHEYNRLPNDRVDGTASIEFCRLPSSTPDNLK